MAKSLCNIRRYRNNRSAKLIAKRILFLPWELLQQLIDLLNQIHRLLIDRKIRETKHYRILLIVKYYEQQK